MIQVEDLSTVRKKLGLSQEKLAEALGVSRNTISRWERSECSPPADKMVALERLLAQHEASAAPGEETAPEETPAPKEPAVPSPADSPQEALLPDVPVGRSKRWYKALMCAGVICALLIGIAALIGIYSIRQQLKPDNIVPEEEIERKEVDESISIEYSTRRPLQP